MLTASPPTGVFVFKTDGSPQTVNVGTVQLLPDANCSTPAGAGIFSHSSQGILLTQSGIPASKPTMHARIYVDTSGGHQTGLAIMNPGDSPQSIAISAFQSDGTTPAGDSRGPLQLNANGHTAAFTDTFVSGLPSGFTGILDISSSTPFAARTLRALNNGRDQIYTTLPVADVTQPAPAPLVFPQIAAGVGGGQYQTQFIFLSAGDVETFTLNFFDDNGSPLMIGKSQR